ncbi:MAG: hypothetical protein HXY41_14550 [Chloroflexi bacterium]|nr:hypothetical protein [Chloroflexota bacterium]
MNLDHLSDKHLHTVERLAQELRLVMRKNNVKDAAFLEALYQLELEAGKVRRERFDATNAEYLGY